MIELRILPRVRDLGDGFQVRSALPDARRRQVGPFVFFDQMGPTALAPGGGLDVRPHPHVGLATVTYLFAGEILHRDSLGTVMPIRPGAVNWMTAGRGIVHSERTPPGLRAAGSRLFGIQTWVALPDEDEEAEPAFSHHADLPEVQESGVTLRLILGDLLGLASPVATFSPIFYADVAMAPGARFAIPAGHEERALHVVEGSLRLAAGEAHPGEMLVLEQGADVVVEAAVPSRFMMLGGAALGPRLVWWNFVSSRANRIREAAGDWTAGRFPSVPGETESIPLPDRPPLPPADVP